MIQTRPSRLLVKVLCVAAAVLAWSAERHAVFAQAKPEAPAGAVPDKPAVTQQPAAQQPGGQQPAVRPSAAQGPIRMEVRPAGPQPAGAKPAQAQQLMGPPNPADETRGGAAGQPAIPAPTVQLKPGEVPAIKFDTMIYEFGRISAGQPVLHDFWFTNTGNGPLEILSVKPS